MVCIMYTMKSQNAAKGLAIRKEMSTHCSEMCLNCVCDGINMIFPIFLFETFKYFKR